MRQLADRSGMDAIQAVPAAQPSRQRSIVRAVPRHRNAPPAANKPGSDTDTGEYLAQAFSAIELLVAADVIKSAISGGRRHVDLEALKGVLAKLTAAYSWKKRGGAT
jgi:hypothetical protein